MFQCPILWPNLDITLQAQRGKGRDLLMWYMSKCWPFKNTHNGAKKETKNRKRKV